METSLSVQNDAILKKAKWWIVSSLVGSFVMWVINSVFGEYLLHADFLYNYRSEVIGILNAVDNTLQLLLWPALFIVGCVVLLKHSVSSIRIFAKMLIIYQSILILAMILDRFGWAIV